MGVRSSFQDVSFKRDQMVVGQVGDIRLCFLITYVCFHWQKLCSFLVSGNRIKGTLLRGQREPRPPNLGIRGGLFGFSCGHRDQCDHWCDIFSCFVWSSRRNVFLLCFLHTPREGRGAQTSCGGRESSLTFKDFEPLRVNSIATMKYWRKQAGSFVLRFF